MRRMYSVQELSEIVSTVVGQKIEDGAFDEVVAGAVDDYLTEHPVDITALEGQDIAPKDIYILLDERTCRAFRSLKEAGRSPFPSSLH